MPISYYLYVLLNGALKTKAGRKAGWLTEIFHIIINTGITDRVFNRIQGCGLVKISKERPLIPFYRMRCIISGDAENSKEPEQINFWDPLTKGNTFAHHQMAHFCPVLRSISISSAPVMA